MGMLTFYWSDSHLCLCLLSCSTCFFCVHVFSLAVCSVCLCLSLSLCLCLCSCKSCVLYVCQTLRSSGQTSPSRSRLWRMTRQPSHCWSQPIQRRSPALGSIAGRSWSKVILGSVMALYSQVQIQLSQQQRAMLHHSGSE